MPSLRSSIVSFLHRTERITHTDNVYLAKNLTYTVLTDVVNILNGFILYLIITRLLSKEIYGEYKYLLSLFSLFSLTTLTGMDPSLSKAVAKGYEGSLRMAFRQKILWGCFGSLITSLVAIYYFIHHNTSLAVSILSIGIFGPLVYAGSLYSSFLSGKKQFALHAKWAIGTGLLSFLGMGAAVLFLHDPLTLFLAFQLTACTNIIAYILMTRKTHNDKIDPDLLPFAKHLSLLEMLSVIANRLDGLIIFHILGPAQLAIYSLAAVPVEQIKGLFKAFQTIAFPKLASNTIINIRKTLTHKLVLLSLAVCLAVLLYILLAPLFFRLFFPAYLDSVRYSRVYGISIIFSVPAAFLLSLFEAKGLRKETAIFNTVIPVTQIILLIVCTSLYGLMGTIVSRIISRGVMLLTNYLMLQRHTTTDP